MRSFSLTRRMTPDSADSTGNGTRIWASNVARVASLLAMAKSHRPLRLSQSCRTIWGRGYSGWALAGETSLAHRVFSGPSAACQAARDGTGTKSKRARATLAASGIFWHKYVCFISMSILLSSIFLSSLPRLPFIRILTFANHWEGGDAQSRGSHRDERHGFSRLVGLHRAGLQFADETQRVLLPRENPFRLHAEFNGRNRWREGLRRQGPAVPLHHFEGLGWILLVEHQSIIPRRGREHLQLGPGICAATALPALADLQGEGKRSIVHRNRILVLRPLLDGNLHWQPQAHRVAVLPFAFEDYVRERLGAETHRLAVDLRRRCRAPTGDAQIKREFHRLRGGELELDRIAERVVSLLLNLHTCSRAHLRAHLAGGVEGRAQAPVRRRQPEFLSVIRPAVRDVVLAAAIPLKRAVGEHGAIVLDLRGFVPLVELDLVCAGQVVQPLPIRREGGGKRVDRYVLAAIGPERVARDLQQHLEAVHELDDAARLKALPRISVSRPTILVSSKAAARELAVEAHDRLVIILGGAEKSLFLRLLEIDARFAKPLRQVHVVPVMHSAGPILHVLVDTLGQL